MTQLITRKHFISLLALLWLMATLAACQANTPQASNAVNETAPAPTAPAAEEAQIEMAAPTPDSITPGSTMSEGAAESSEQPVASGGAKTFRLVQAGTVARFYIDEILMGADKTVVGETALVEGELTVDPTNPSSAQISPIRIDARDLTTDSDRRNGAIQRFVLQSSQDAYRYITFIPTAVEGLPATVTIGEPFQFTVTGDLTIRDVTRPESFPMTVTANAEDELVGSGAITILRDEYQLSIPSVPSVAWVADEVKLEIVFTATAQ